MAWFSSDGIEQFVRQRMCFGMCRRLMNVTGSISFANVVTKSMGIQTKRFVGTKSSDVSTQFHKTSWSSCTFHQIAHPTSRRQVLDAKRSHELSTGTHGECFSCMFVPGWPRCTKATQTISINACFFATKGTIPTHDSHGRRVSHVERQIMIGRYFFVPVNSFDVGTFGQI